MTRVRWAEEPYLTRIHQSYLGYAARTGRFLPGRGRTVEALTSGTARGGDAG